ncbi:MAG TPA: RsmE family RNA methyltransferase [Candidatus Limnocylindrales bacterium]|nr:RsmE family RNA methyltransferase [Candidatus Limnocylindrales bacterium]
MRRRFFVENFESGSAALHGDAAEHVGRVLRAEAGQLYELSDGREVWLARVREVALPKRGESRIEFELLERIAASEPRLRVSVLLSIVKFDRFEWCIEKATELGATEIIPLAATRSEKALIAAAAKRRERWEKIAFESAQQSRRLRAPAIGAMARATDAFAAANASVKLILSERPDSPPIRQTLEAAGTDVNSAVLAIGPEGGWTDEELAAARTAGFREASLGETILRTETAVIAALSVLRFALTP